MDPTASPPPARVRIGSLGWPFTLVPDEVRDLIEVTTDKDGLAILDGGSNDEVTYVNVHTGSFGIQGRSFLPPSSKAKRISLRSVASLKGRLVADDPAMARGWRVWAHTEVGKPASRSPATTGFAMGTTDAEGRFSFPIIASGELQLNLEPPCELPVLADIPSAFSVVEGRENSIEVPLRKAATVTGLVRERGRTGRSPAPRFLLPLGERARPDREDR